MVLTILWCLGGDFLPVLPLTWGAAAGRHASCVPAGAVFWVVVGGGGCSSPAPAGRISHLGDLVCLTLD